MRVLVMTIVHHPEDARILHRQIRSLVKAGHEVVFAAPFGATGTEPRWGVQPVDLPRAKGRARSAAIGAARRAYRRLRDEVDITVLHDPELLMAVSGVRGDRPVVWDVHEDTAAALGLKGWLPRPARPVVSAGVRLSEAAAERSLRLILAEQGYVDRFRERHPVVPNETVVPDRVSPPGTDRVVYLGALSTARGTAEMIETARLLRPYKVRVHLMGSADQAAGALLRSAVADDVLDWDGFVPNDVALERLDGALAGISLLHDEPNYRHSMPTKVVEYMAYGLPVVTTPTPPALALVRRHMCGSVVPFGDPVSAVRAILRLRDDARVREGQARRGHAAARAHHDWRVSGARFVAQLEAWSTEPVAVAAPGGRSRLRPGTRVVDLGRRGI